MTISWIARRWCVVEQDEQRDLFVGDPWHIHLVDINLRLDTPRERTLCSDLLPAQPIYRELTRRLLSGLCPQCLATARSLRQAGRQTAPKINVVDGTVQQFDMYELVQRAPMGG